MSEVKKIATRASYGNALVELGKKHDDLVVLDADLAAATQTGIFKKAFPERHIDCGIAAGLSTAGKVPFASSFAMFAAGRAFEQVRNMRTWSFWTLTLLQLLRLAYSKKNFRSVILTVVLPSVI